MRAVDAGAKAKLAICAQVPWAGGWAACPVTPSGHAGGECRAADHRVGNSAELQSEPWGDREAGALGADEHQLLWSPKQPHLGALDGDAAAPSVPPRGVVGLWKGVQPRV